MKTQEEQLAALKKTMDELAAKQDFTGAAAAKAKVKIRANLDASLIGKFKAM